MIYDESYYERGIETGKSNFQNYRWIPELTIPMAMTIIDFLQIKTGESVLDYGCAKMYFVKALRMLHRDAYGYDISDYALSKADEDTKPYILTRKQVFSRGFDYVICKDVLEHISVEDLKPLLSTLNVTTVFTVVPLGRAGKYIASANDRDITHIICEPVQWWLNLFHDCGWSICCYASTEFKGIKDSYPKGSFLFMVHRR